MGYAVYDKKAELTQTRTRIRALFSLEMEVSGGYASKMADGFGRSSASVAILICLLALSVLLLIWNFRKKSRDRSSSSSSSSISLVHPEMQASLDDFRLAFARVNAPIPDDESVQRLLHVGAHSDRHCPICFGSSNFTILTNCGHVFCCGCIVAYWKHSAAPLSPVSCAICRTAVTMLLPLDWPREVLNGARPDPAEGEPLSPLDLLDAYNRKFSAGRAWLHIIRDIPVLIPYLLSNLLSYSGIVAVFRARAVVCFVLLLLYTAWPFDVLPESVYGLLGLADDVFVVAIAALYLCVAFREYMAQRGGRPPAHFQ